MDVDKIFATFGGPTSVGAILGVKRGHAALMKMRHSIPPEYWPPLVAEAKRRGIRDITYETLAHEAAMRRVRSRKVA